MTKSTTKSERLLQLEYLLVSHPEGLRRAEVARRLGLHRSTVGRYIDELSRRLPIWEHDFLVGIEEKGGLDPAVLTDREGIALLLCADALVRRTDRRFPHASSALRKIANAIASVSVQVSVCLRDYADELDNPDRHMDPHSTNMVDIISDAWILQRQIEITRCVDGRMQEIVLEPRYIGFVDTPGRIDSLVVSGYIAEEDDVLSRFTVIPIDEIREAVLLSTRYRIPAGGCPRRLLGLDADESPGGHGRPKSLKALGDDRASDGICCDGGRFDGGVRFCVMVKQGKLITHVEQMGGVESGCMPGIDGWRLFRLETSRPAKILPQLLRHGWDLEILAPLCTRLVFQYSNLAEVSAFLASGERESVEE